MSLLRIAESDYTGAMVCLLTRAFRFVGPFLGAAATVALFTGQGLVHAASPPPERTAHELYNALDALHVDPATVYRLETENRVLLRRGIATLSFDEGKLGFFVALDGKITGMVFSGRGHALAAPRDPVEKQQVARFLGASVLDEDFSSAYVRFTDGTAEQLLAELQTSKVIPQNDPEFAARWDPLVREFNAGQNLRILNGSLSRNPKPYFYAGLDGSSTGPFDVIYDMQRRESFLLGQPRHVIGQLNGPTLYDVWVSYALPADPVARESFRALNYSIDATIDASKSLDAKATVEIEAVAGGDRLLPFALSRSLTLDRLTDEQGAPLEFFQNEGLTAQARNDHGNDSLVVVLPHAASAGEHFHLRFHYRGTVIEDAGNGVLVVQARDSWYPHLGDTADFAPYELTMRWPRKMQLVATGTKLDERTDGEYRVGRWRTETPVPVAGFNLGEYISASVEEPTYLVAMYANQQLELSVSNRMRSSGNGLDGIPMSRGRTASPEGGSFSEDRVSETPLPRPADALKALGKEIDASIRFYENFSGPFPFRSLSVSQIPGNFGQGWPGLLYLSTYAYLSPEAQRQAGLSVSGQEHFTQLVPFHEVAHQWWGNLVGWSSYRDQWINEALASYLALMFADSHRPQDHELRVWLERFRKSLILKPLNGDQAPAETGALTLGARLNSSKAPQDYEVLIYSKGSWVIHMLREMLRQPGAKNPDARFTLLLQTLAKKYAYRALTTADLQKEVEAVMTPAMDLEGGRSMEWFFDEWIRGTGIPRYHVDFTATAAEKGGFLIKGTLFQNGVPRSFIAPVPIYASSGIGRPVFLGNVTAEGPKTTFHFVTPIQPRKLLVDSEMTLLATSE